jgi:hypothetical protein
MGVVQSVQLMQPSLTASNPAGADARHAVASCIWSGRGVANTKNKYTTKRKWKEGDHIVGCTRVPGKMRILLGTCSTPMSTLMHHIHVHRSRPELMHVELSSRARTTAYLELFEQQANPKPVILPEGLAMQPPKLAVSNALGPVERSSSVTRACLVGLKEGQ